MAKVRRANGSHDELRPLTSISVEGFKSIQNEQTIVFRPLTILAGVNSSGKSSMIQSLLLMKQTLEASYDPGALLLDGPNAKFTKVAQLISKGRQTDREGRFVFGLSLEPNNRYKVHFKRGEDFPIDLERAEINTKDGPIVLKPGKSDYATSSLAKTLPAGFIPLDKKLSLQITRNRCFLESTISNPAQPEAMVFSIGFGNVLFEEALLDLIHVPGLRGNPQRNYPLTAVGERFPGTFEVYAASVIAIQQERNPDFVKQLGSDLLELKLTWRVMARHVGDTQVELLVGRLAQGVRGGTRDLVSIADVGFGVSQTLPVVAALLTARPGQMAYIEQPEIHLHPRAQHAMAKLLARAANRGVQVIIETHSSLLLLGVQSLIATGDLDPAKVKLHWFHRSDKTGATEIASADIDAAGRFGDWPEDFDDVALEAQQAYLDAAEQKIAP